MSRRNRGAKKTVEKVEDWATLVSVYTDKPYTVDLYADDAAEAPIAPGDEKYREICDEEGNVSKKPLFPTDGRITVQLRESDTDNDGKGIKVDSAIETALFHHPCRGGGKVPPQDARCTGDDYDTDTETGYKKYAESGVISSTNFKWKKYNLEQSRFRAAFPTDTDDRDSDDEDSDDGRPGRSLKTTPAFPINELAVSIGTKAGISAWLICRMTRAGFSTPEKANTAFTTVLSLYNAEYMKKCLGVTDTVMNSGSVYSKSGQAYSLPLSILPPMRADAKAGCALVMEDVACVEWKSPYNSTAYAYRAKDSTEASLSPVSFGTMVDGVIEYMDLIELVAWALGRLPENSASPDFGKDLVITCQGWFSVSSFSFIKKSVKGSHNPNGTNISDKYKRLIRAIALDARFEATSARKGGPTATVEQADQQIIDDADDF
jgi:hypothetical protein